MLVECDECEGTGRFSPTPNKLDWWVCIACNGSGKAAPLLRRYDNWGGVAVKRWNEVPITALLNGQAIVPDALVLETAAAMGLGYSTGRVQDDRNCWAAVDSARCVAPTPTLAVLRAIKAAMEAREKKHD